MSKIPSHYSLVKEHAHSYEIHDARDDKKFHIAKQGLDLGMHAKLANIQKFADGGEVSTPELSQSQIDAVNAYNPNSTPIPDDSIASGVGPSALFNVNPSAPPPIPTSQDPNAINYPPDTTQGPAPASVDTTTTSQAAPIPGDGAPANPPADNSMPIPTGSGQAIDSAIGATNNLANAQTKQANLTAQAYKDQADQMAKLPDIQTMKADYDKKDQQLMDAFMSKKVDPDHYWSTKGAGSKVSAGIGMLFSGIGSGLSGQPNMAMENITKNIDRDIDAQKNAQDKAGNLWKMNRERFGTDLEATAATRNQLISATQAKINQYAAAVGGPEAKQKAAMAIIPLQQEKQQNNMMLAAMKAQNQPGFSQADPSQLVPYLVKNPDQQKQVYEEIGRAQNVAKNSDQILKAFDDSSKENTVMRTGAGMIRTPGSVMQLHQMLLPNFKQIDGTVRQAAMDETFHNVTPAPGDDQHKIDQKKQALIDWMHSETAAPIAKGNNLDLQKFASTSADPVAKLPPQIQNYAQWARRNPNDPRAKIVMQKLGINQ